MAEEVWEELIALLVQYKGQTHMAKLPLTDQLVAHLAIEAEFRGMDLIELIGQIIEAVVKKNRNCPGWALSAYAERRALIRICGS